MRRLFGVLLGLMLLVATQRAALATGICEDTLPTYDPPELFDPVTRSFAIPVRQPWCDANPQGNDMEEIRGASHYVELRDTTGKVLGTLTASIGTDLEHLKQHVPSVEVIAAGKLHATLVKRGYLAIAGKEMTACRIVAAWTDVEASGGWRAAKVQLDVMKGSTRVARVMIGNGTIERRGDVLIKTRVVGKTGVAVFATVPSCDGPPPGHFGPEDAGSCYRVDVPVVKLLDASTVPGCL